jgi:hypothetical protein
MVSGVVDVPFFYSVWLAVDQARREEQRSVEAAMRLRFEGTMLTAAKHPAVLPCFGICENDERIGLVTAEASGTVLEAWAAALATTQARSSNGLLLNGRYVNLAPRSPERTTDAPQPHQQQCRNTSSQTLGVGSRGKGDSAADSKTGSSTAFVLSALHSVAEGLAFVHSIGMLHRDVKPQNIFVCDGVAVLGDFDRVSDDQRLSTLAPSSPPLSLASKKKILF